MTTLSIHQPSYFPWLGLLDKIANSDVYMVMDQVQLSDSGYQHRNTFLTSAGEVRLLTIPFLRKNYFARPLRELEIANDDWRRKHWNFIRTHYGKHPFAAEILPLLDSYYTTSYLRVCDAVVASMRIVLDVLGIRTRIIFQSDMQYDRSLRRGELVGALVRSTGADVYVSGTGARDYLEGSTALGRGQIMYNDFRHPRYPQKGTVEFRPGLSSLDMLFNVGCATGRRMVAGGCAR